MKSLLNSIAFDAIGRTAARLVRFHLPVFALIAIALLGFTAFVSPPAPGDDFRNSSQSVIAHFWRVDHGNDFKAIPQVEAELQRAIGLDPGNVSLVALLGAASFWHCGEGACERAP